MSKFYQSYLKAFDNYAHSILKKFNNLSQISIYATMLTDKAVKLMNRAMSNGLSNASDLQKEIFESGRVYVRKYAQKFKNIKHPSIQDDHIKIGVKAHNKKAGERS